MKKAMFKDMVMEIKHTYKRFISILLIILLGAGFFAGIKSVSPDMKIAGDNYLDDSDFMDFKLISTVGLNDEDVEAIEGADGIDEVMPSYSFDVLVEENEKELVIKLMTLPFINDDVSYINKVQLIEGRLPKKNDECVTEQEVLNAANLKIGDKLKISDTSFDEDTNDLLSTKEYTIVGIVDSPIYMSIERGSTNLGSGSINGFAYIPDTSVNSDYYTEVYVTMRDAKELRCFEDDYKELIESETKELDELARDRKDEGYYEIVNAYNSKITEGREEIDSYKDELDDKINEANEQIEEAKSIIIEAEEELAQQESMAQEEFANAESKINNAWNEYYAKEEEFNNSKAQAEAQINSIQESVSDARNTVNSINSMIDASNSVINTKKNQIASKQNEITAKQNQITSNQNQIASKKNEITTKQNQITSKRSEIATKQSQINTKKNEIATKQSQIVQKQRELMYNWWNAAAINAQINQLRQEIINLNNDINTLNNDIAKLYNEISTLNNQIIALNNQINTLNNQISTLNSQISKLKSEISTLNAEIEVENKKIAEYRAKISEANAIVSRADEQADSIRQAINSSQRELDNARAEIERSQANFNATKNSTYADIEEGRKQIEEAKKQVAEKEKEIEEERLNAENIIQDAEKELEAVMEQFDEIKRPEWYVLDRESTEAYVSYFQDADRVGAVAQVFPVIFFVVAALVSLTSMTRMVEEQRSQIGTLKALGYNKWQIISKYIWYSMIATLIGGIIGIFLGVEFLPRIIFDVYSIMYNVPEIVIEFNATYIIIAIILSVACTCGATLLACMQSLKEVPAILMRPKAPKIGKRIFLEKIPFIWKRINFSNKVTARNIFRYKKRFFMTVVGIGGCTALLVAGFGLKEAVTSMVPTQYEDIFTYNLQISYKDKATDEEKEEFEDSLYGNYGIQSFIKGSQIAMEFEANDIVKDGYLLVAKEKEELTDYISLQDRITKEKYSLDDNGVIITEKLAKLLNIKVGDTIVIRNIDNEEVEAKISAICENYILHYVIMSKDLYKDLYGREPKYNNLLVKSDELSSDEEESNLKSILNNDIISAAQYSRTISRSFVDAMDSLNSVVLVLIVSAGALAFVVLYNLSNINIGERTRELATIKVLGFYDKEVSKYVYKENIILTIFGICAGIFMGYFLNTYMITTCEVDLVMFTRELSIQSILMAIIITAIFSIIVNFVTHFSLKKIDMIESLKSIE